MRFSTSSSTSQPCRKAILLTMLVLVATVFGSAVPDQYRIRGKAETVIDQGVRRDERSKMKGPVSKTPKDYGKIVSITEPPDEDDSPPDGVTVTANGLTMTLGGVNALDMEGRETWEAITRDFIEADITRLTKELAELEVNVVFESQNPPYEPESRLLVEAEVRGAKKPLYDARQLADTEVYGVPLGARPNVVEITFNVVIDIASNVEEPNANLYVAHAFSSDIRKTAYMRKLLATNYDAFFNIGSVTVDAKLSSETEKDPMEIGAIVGFAIMGFICISMVAYIVYRTKSKTTDSIGTAEAKDSESEKRTNTETVLSVSSGDEGNAPRKTPHNEPPSPLAADDSSFASSYHEGNISVAWSLDTDVPHTPRIANSKTLLGALSRESSEEGSLFYDDDIEVQTPVISPIHGAPLAVSPLLDEGPSPYVIPPPHDDGLYDI